MALRGTQIASWAGLLLLLAALVGACDQISQLSEITEDGPKSTLTEYMDALIDRNWTVAYGLVSAEDKAVKSLSEYRAEGSNPFAEFVASGTSYEIVEFVKSGDTATAQMDVTRPDLSGMLADFLKAAWPTMMSEGKGEAKDPEALLKERAAAGDLPLKTERIEYTLVREEDGWRVFLDWKTKGKISALLAEADQLRKQQKLLAAKQKYDEILDLESALVNASEIHDQLTKARKASGELTEEIREFKEKEQYVPKVKLYDFSSKYFQSTFKGRVPGVEFKLKNEGDRTLNEVEVTVYFKDGDGNVISEEDFHPVLVSKYLISDSKPLKPGYIWQMERGQFYSAASVPSEWKEGAATARITDIEFADE
jgi:hypothetical protein